MFDLTTLLVTCTICFPAIALASRKSDWLVDYLFFVVALNRGIRRFVDYQNGFFNPTSLISLTPIIVGGLAVLVILSEFNTAEDRFGRQSKSVLKLYGGAVTFAFVIGLINIKLGAVYALGDYIAPIGLMGFGILRADDEATMNRWCNSFAVSVLAVASYGVWQFYTIPAWDAFWLVEVNFVGYMGYPEPTKMSLFSTMNERGPAALYLCNGLMLLILRSGTLGAFRWPAALMILYAMLLTYSRTSIIFAGLAFVLYPVLNRGSGLFPVAAIALLIGVAGPSILAKMPGQASARVETLGAIQDDGSFKGRVYILKHSLSEALTEPLGLGLGAHGLASRIQKASKSGQGDSTGYVETLMTYGWIGFLIICVVLWKLWQASSQLVNAGVSDKNILLFRAWFIAGMVALFSGNWLVGASFFWVLAGYCLGRSDEADSQFRWDEDSLDVRELDELRKEEITDATSYA